MVKVDLIMRKTNNSSKSFWDLLREHKGGLVSKSLI